MKLIFNSLIFLSSLYSTSMANDCISTLQLDTQDFNFSYSCIFFNMNKIEEDTVSNLNGSIIHQSETDNLIFDKLKEEFATTYCNCLDSLSTPDDYLNLFGRISMYCIGEYFQQHPKSALILFKDVVEYDSLKGLVEAEFNLGELMPYTIDVIVKRCQIFKMGLKELKQKTLEKLDITPESTPKYIQALEVMREKSNEDRDKGSICMTLGILYEYVGDKEKAMEAYEKAIELYNLIPAYGLKELLEIGF